MVMIVIVIMTMIIIKDFDHDINVTVISTDGDDCFYYINFFRSKCIYLLYSL